MGIDFTDFDPGKHSGGTDAPLPPGNYVLTVKAFRRETRKGKRQIDFIVIPVLDADGNRFDSNAFSPIWETITLTEAAAWRLARLLEAIRIGGPINVMSDQALSAGVRWKPFKANVAKDSYNGRVRAKIAKYLPLTEREAKLFAGVLEDIQMESQLGGGGGDDHGFAGDNADDDYGFGSGPGNGNGRAGGQGYDGGTMPDENQGRVAPRFDDDIPF